MSNLYKYRYVIMPAVIGALIFVAYLMLRDDLVEQKAGAAPSTTTTTEWKLDHVENGGPYTDELSGIAGNIDLDTYGKEWTFGIVSEDKDTAVTVKIAKGL